MIKKNNVNSFFILLPYLWLATGMLLYKSGDKAMIALILVSMIFTFLTEGMAAIREKVFNNRSCWIVILVATYAVFQYFYHGISSREVRSLVASALILITFPRWLLTQKLLNYLALFGSILSFMYTIYWGEYLQASRSTWSINAIPYATLTAVFGVLALSQLTEKCSLSQKTLSLFILLLTVTTLAINETRGVLVAFLAVLIFFTTTNIKFKELTLKQIIFSLVLIITSAILLKPFLEDGYQRTLVEINNLEKGNQNTSIGLRLQMWQTTPHMIKGNYILGLGNSHSDRIETLYKEGLISKSLYQFFPKDYHNQYINWLIKHGVIGFILTTLLIFLPLFFSRGLSDFQKKYIRGIVVLFATASLTDVSLHQGQTIFIFCLLAYSHSSKNEYKE
jgi:O-antigen ligase